MVDPALEGLYPAKSLSRFADAIALCVQVNCLSLVAIFPPPTFCTVLLIDQFPIRLSQQPEPEFRPPMSEVVQSLVRLVQRSSMGAGLA
uniref:Uncharacterized protein n=1 Tax=Setaria italica TaxID=4555 RepID=K4AP37_SETIT